MPLLTFTSDIGQQDFVVGAVKGQLHTAIPNLTIADITHFLPQDNFAHATYILKNAFKYYPDNTFHFILLNVFEADSLHFVVSKYNNQFIICPNHGILSMIADGIPESSVVLPVINANNIIQITEQVITALAKIIATNSLEVIGTKGLSIVEKTLMTPTIGENWIEGQILFIDNFENAVVNITQEVFENERKNRKFKIVFKRNEVVTKISKNYSTVSESHYLVWFNAAGYLELAINKGAAASLFGLETFKEKIQNEGLMAQNKWFYRTVRILFE